MYTVTYWAPNRCEPNTIYLWYPGTSQWRVQGRVLGERVPPSPLFLDQTEKFFLETTTPPPPHYLRVWMTAPYSPAPPPHTPLISRSGTGTVSAREPSVNNKALV